MDFGGIFISSWNDQRSPRGRGRKDPMISGEVSAGCRRQNGKFGHEILPLENDSARSVTPPTFQTVEEPTIGQWSQTFGSHGGSARISAQSFKAHTITGFYT